MKKWLKRLKKDERGLTLVELLAVVVILAIVAAIAFISIGNVIENSKKDAHIANAQQIISAVKLAEASGDVDFSTAVNALDEEEINTIGSMVDPWEKAKYSKAEVTKAGDVYSITLTPVEASAGKCPIDGESESDLQEGRKAVCNG